MNDRLGVRGRLFLAFFGISAFAVLAAAAAMYSFVEAGNALKQITQDRVPATIASQQLSRQAERIASAAPAMLTVTSPEQHEQMSTKLSAEFDRLEALLGVLEDRDVNPTSLSQIKILVARLDINLTTIDTMIFNNLVLVEQMNELRRDLGFAAIASRRLLAPGILVMDAKVAELRKALADRAPANEQDSGEIARLAEPIVSQVPLQRLEAEISAINDMLIEAGSAKTLPDLEVLKIPLGQSLDTLETMLADVEPFLRKRLDARLAAFREFATGPEGIVSTRARQLRHLSLMQTLLDENVEISRQLTEAVDALVASARRDIREANFEALSVQETSTIIMIAVVALSLACSTLIVWLYVGRNLVARLTGLSESMLAIANGDLETPIPAAGGDEIGQMAKALSVFRATAIEVRDTNLREIRTARQRLIDAIESISEGFSLYDADDRLVVCNSTYIRIMYPGIEDAVTPGMSFEAIIRTAVERGLIADAEGRVEEWLAERLARHRNPGAAHVQRRGDGRWILISERRTEDGSTVAVYSDITELKEREEELAVKSNALEQLSNQLAKYLAPQVYESIFSGRQEVKLTSRRRKLTVFFSDIAGFTETADRLESEELTQLLNHYLTEMTEIALAHGATIDKYMGDGVMIFFGDPETRGVKEDALTCVQMAIAMRRRMRDLQDTWRESGIENPLQVRMGIHTGFCTVGNFGSESRMDYTIVGGAVNAASRMQAHAPPGEILISYETFAHVKDHVLCEERGQVEVKGLAYPLATYRVVDTFDNLGGERRHFSEEHPTLTLDMKLDEMTQDDRTQAEEILRRALRLLSRRDAP